MDSKKYQDDLSEIRSMMSKSSRFISLSGLSGILAGVYALFGAGAAHQRIRAFNQAAIIQPELETGGDYIFADENHLMLELGLIAGAVMILALATAIWLSQRKARRSGEALWTPSSKRLVLNFFIPLGAGGLFCLAMLQYGFAALVAPAMLLFYGLSCLNAGKYTLGDVRSLGIAMIVLGLIATQFVGYGLLFWAIGFGAFHILYGTIMHFKYDK